MIGLAQPSVAEAYWYHIVLVAIGCSKVRMLKVVWLETQFGAISARLSNQRGATSIEMTREYLNCLVC